MAELTEIASSEIVKKSKKSNMLLENTIDLY